MIQYKWSKDLALWICMICVSGIMYGWASDILHGVYSTAGAIDFVVLVGCLSYLIMYVAGSILATILKAMKQRW